MSETSSATPIQPLKPPLLRHGEVAGDAVDFRIVEAVGRELVVRRQPLEHGRALEEQIGLVGRGGGAGQSEDGSESESQFAHGNLQRCPRQLVIHAVGFNQAQSGSSARSVYSPETNSP